MSGTETNASETAATWRGASALRPFLIPIDELEPFPGNPRRGDVEEVRASLRRWGQTRPILVDAGDGRRIVAGHHVRLAAAAEGWTHVAAIPNEFDSEEEARAYLLADNGTHERGDYDPDDLHAQLVAVRAAAGGLVGTGYDDEHIMRLQKQREELERLSRPPEEFPPLRPGEIETHYKCPNCAYEWSGNPAPGAPEE